MLASHFMPYVLSGGPSAEYRACIVGTRSAAQQCAAAARHERRGVNA